jgi:hypothetical protein
MVLMKYTFTALMGKLKQYLMQTEALNFLILAPVLKT